MRNDALVGCLLVMLIFLAGVVAIAVLASIK